MCHGAMLEADPAAASRDIHSIYLTERCYLYVKSAMSVCPLLLSPAVKIHQSESPACQGPGLQPGELFALWSAFPQQRFTPTSQHRTGELRHRNKPREGFPFQEAS